jgi:hypothetical protein
MIQITFGVFEIVLDVFVQAATVAIVLRYMMKHKWQNQRKNKQGVSDLRIATTLATVMVVLFLGHMVQIASWAVPFRFFGQFDDFGTAFYHSAVNYTALGYGDIVMDEGWRVLGALEAADGMLMFGVSTATFFAIMSTMMRNRMASPQGGGGDEDTEDA